MRSSSFFALLVLFGQLALATTHKPVDPNITLAVNDGFCDNGTARPLVPSSEDPPHLKIWGDFCFAENKATALAKTSTFLAPKFLRIYMIGWEKSPTVAIERVSDGTKFLLVPHDESPEVWSLCDFSLPSDWQGKPARLVFEGVPEKGFWRAFSEPLAVDGPATQGDAIQILGLTLLHYAAFLLCALAVTAWAVYRGLRDRIQAGLITLAATAIPGYCMFWITLGTQRFSRDFAVMFVIAAFLVLVVCLRKLDHEGLLVLRSLIGPLLLPGALAVMVLSSGFLYGGTNNALAIPRGRYLPQLPPDNELPLRLALGARLPHVPSPLQGVWLSSDRPPLQSGTVLAHFPLFRRPHELGYTIVSVLAQSFWVFGLWLLLTAFKLNTRAVALTLAVCIFSGFAFLNTFFVWPKMLAAAYAFGFLASFVAKPAREHSRLVQWVVPGALFGLSLLAHGGTVFALLPAVPLILLWQGLSPINIKRMVAVLSFAFLIYLPWILYQKFYDPPGNHLLKLHLAGVDTIDHRSFSETLKTAYSELRWNQILINKKQNFVFSFGEGFLGLQRRAILLKTLLTPRNWPEAAKLGLQLREHMFFHPAPCLGLFILAPYALLAGLSRRFRTVEWRVACVLWVFTFVAMSLWCLLMFGGSTTSIHQGAYATMLLAFAAGVLSFWAISPRLAVTVASIHIGIEFILNELLDRVPFPSGWLPEGLLHKDTLLLLCVSFAAVCWLLLKLPPEGREPSLQV